MTNKEGAQVNKQSSYNLFHSGELWQPLLIYHRLTLTSQAQLVRKKCNSVLDKNIVLFFAPNVFEAFRKMLKYLS